MKQTDWKIIYNNYSGMSKKAINLLSKEAGRFLIRDEMEYSIYILPCEKEGCEVSKNAFSVFGAYCYVLLYNVLMTFQCEKCIIGRLSV